MRILVRTQKECEPTRDTHPLERAADRAHQDTGHKKKWAGEGSG
jgi:hypothetical protein